MAGYDGSLESVGRDRERRMADIGASSRVSNLQKLMEMETENIRQFKVDSERRIEQQRLDIQTKAAAVVRLQKQLSAALAEKEEALASMKENERKCDELAGRLGKFTAKYRRVVDGVAQRDKDEERLKDNLRLHMEDKAKLTAELDRAGENLVRLLAQVEAAKDENVERILRLREEIRRTQEAKDELSAELAATKEAQFLAIEKVSFLEQENSRARRERETAAAADAAEKQRLSKEVKEAEKSIVRLEADLRECRTEAGRKAEEAGAKYAASIEEKDLQLKNLEVEKGNLESRIRSAEEERRRLEEEKGTLAVELGTTETDLATKTEECRQLEEQIVKQHALMAEVKEAMEGLKEREAGLKEEHVTLNDSLSYCQGRIEKLEEDEKKYQAEILFRHETLQQREAEYTNLSQKLKEILGEKDGIEAELVTVKANLAAENAALEKERSAKEAAEREVGSLTAEVANEREQLVVYRTSCDKLLSEKNALQSEAVHLQATLKSLEHKLASSDTRCNALQEAETRLAAEIANLNAQVERLSDDSNVAGVKWKAETEKAAAEAEAQRKRYDEALIEARQSSVNLEKELLEAKKAKEDQAQSYEAKMADLQKDRDQLRTYNRNCLSRAQNEAKVADVKLARMTEKFEEKEKDLLAEKAKVTALEERLTSYETHAGDTRQEAAEEKIEAERRIAELEAELAEKGDELERKSRETEEERRVAAEREKSYQLAREASAASEARVAELMKDVSDLKLNLELKGNECRGLQDRIARSEPTAAETPTSAARIEGQSPNSAPNRATSGTIAGLSPSSGRASPLVAAISGTPIKTTMPPPVEQSPAIKRSVSAKFATIESKKPKVTFGGESSRFISDHSDQDQSPESRGADSFISQLAPKTPRQTGARPLRRLSTPSPNFGASTSAIVEPMAHNGGGDAVSTGVNPPKMTKKFAELKAKNDVRRAEKARKSAEVKAKYGNKFNELKAKNEERKRQKEAAKAAKASPAADDGESSGCDWF